MHLTISWSKAKYHFAQVREIPVVHLVIRLNVVFVDRKV